MHMELLVPHSINIKRIKQMFEPHLFFIILLWGLSRCTCYFFALLLPLVHSPITPCCFALLYLTILFWCVILLLCLLVVVKPWSSFLGLFREQIRSWNGKFEVFFSKFGKFTCEIFHFVCVCVYTFITFTIHLHLFHNA